MTRWLGKARTVKCDLLLDARGFVVGVDLRDHAGIVVMLGPHEAVATQVAARVEVFAAGAGAEIAHVRITQARRVARGDEKNPYV